PAIRRPILDDALVKLPGRPWRRAHEGVSRPRLATGGRRLQEKGEWTVAKLRECRDRRLGIEQHVAPDGNESGAIVVRGRTARARDELLNHCLVPVARR